MSDMIIIIMVFVIGVTLLLLYNKARKVKEASINLRGKVESNLQSPPDMKSVVSINNNKVKKEIPSQGIRAKITGREKYGLFVDLSMGISGLLHMSNLHKGKKVSDYLNQDVIYVEEIPSKKIGKRAFKAVGEAPKTEVQIKDEVIRVGQKKIYYISNERTKKIILYFSLDEKFAVLAGILCHQAHKRSFMYEGKGIQMYLFSNAIRLDQSPLNANYIYTLEGLSEKDKRDKHAAVEKCKRDKYIAEEEYKTNELKNRFLDFKKTFYTVNPIPIFSETIKCSYSGRATKDHKPEGRYDAKPTIDVRIYGDIFSVDGVFYIQGIDSGNYTYRKESYDKGLGTIDFREWKNYASYKLEKPKITKEENPLFEIINGKAYTASETKSFTSMEKTEAYLSTSNLGREIGISPKELIAYFIDSGLLKRVNKVLTLTDLGKQYGGTHNSNGNESWVVWPKSIRSKPIVANYGKLIAMPKQKISSSLEDKISHFGFYHPYNHGQNLEFDAFSGYILDLKRDKLGMVDYFFDQLKNIDFNATEAIVIVPSHTPQNRISPVKKIAQKLARVKGWIDATDCVIRTHEIDKLASGGDRSMDVQLRSLKIINQHLLEGKNILVFDDVTTSGNSLFATMKLLKEYNINSVWSYAIAKTN